MISRLMLRASCTDMQHTVDTSGEFIEPILLLTGMREVDDNHNT